MDAQTQTAETIPPQPTGNAAQPPGAEAPKRKRGRPFGSRTSPPPLTETGVPPESGEPQPAEPKKRRRRAVQVDVEKLRKQIAGMHQLVSRAVHHLTGSEDMAKVIILDDTECAMLSEAYAQIAREYDIELFGGKFGAVIQLIGAAAIVYGPRAVVLHAMAEHLKRQRPATVEGEAQEIPANGAAAAAH